MSSDVEVRLKYIEEDIRELKASIKYINEELSDLRVKVATIDQKLKALGGEVSASTRRYMWLVSLITGTIVSVASIIATLLAG